MIEVITTVPIRQQLLYFYFFTEILLQETSFKGFPVVDDMECMRLYGYVRRKELQVALGKDAHWTWDARALHVQ
jgi:hypothetical protein